MDANAVTALVGKYISIWNELDDRLRRTMIDDVFTPDAEYVDPTVAAAGVAAIGDNIAAAQQNFTGMRFSHGEILTHHDTAHFSWQVGPPSGPPVVTGFDVMVFEDGRISRVYGFFDAA